MVSPERKREAVEHVCQQVENVSERRACKVVRQARSTQRYRARKPGKDAAIRAELRRIAVANPRAGYRMARALLARAGLEMNAKKVHRLWREEGLRVSRRTRKRARQGSGENSAQRKAAEGINHVWSYDFIFDQTADGRRLKWLLICDEFSRELVAVKVERKLKAQDVISVLEKAVQERGAPEFIRSDNGPEFVAHAVKDWIEKSGFATLYIKPGAPWQNAYIESLNSRFRDEFLNVELFGSLVEAKVLGEDYCRRYNRERPHSSLDYQTPAEYAAAQPNRSDGGYAPPNPALLAAEAFGGTGGASAPQAASHINNQLNQKHEILS